MAIIYTYPTKASPAADDLILISDSADSNKTKQIKVSSLPGGSSAGVSSLNTLTGAVTITGGTNVTLTTVGNNIEINAAGGGSLTVKDEGVDLTTSASSINFTGVGVTATTVGNDVTVNIPDAYVIEDIQLASAVSKGTALYVSGPAHGSGRVTVDIADATDNTKMPVVGLALANYSAGEGKMIVAGVLDNVDTSNTNIPGGVLGKVVYVDSSGVDNNLTGTKPTGTDLIQNVGIIIKSGANGAIQVACIGRTNDLPNLNQGSLFIGNASNQATTLGIGGNNTVLTSNGTTASWAANTGGGITFSGSTADGLATFASTSSAAVNSEVKLLADGQMTFDGSSGNTGIKFDSSTNTLRVGDIVGNSDIVALYSDGAAKITVSDSDVLVADTMQFQQGLKFGVSGSTLSTYTEATWTSGPTLTFSVGGTATLSASSGSYRVIGDMVFAQFQFTFGSGGYGTADLSLPVSGIAGTGSINFVKMNSNVGNSTVSTPVTGNINFNSASIRLKSFNYDQDSASHVSGQLFELVDTSGQPIFQNGDIVSGTIIYRKV